MKDETPTVQPSSFKIHPLSFIAGLSASFLTILLGNLGTIQLVFQRLQQLGALGEVTTEASIPQRWTWAFQGILLTFKGSTLPIGFGDWYWNPSRVIPPGGGNEITEFPLFTFLYSDGEGFQFMNSETYDQITLQEDLVGDQAVYLQPEMKVMLSMHEGTPISIVLPQKVVLEVTETEPTTKGQTASSSYKPAVLSNGVRTAVPPFITTGTRIVVMTADGSYVERAKD